MQFDVAFFMAVASAPRLKHRAPIGQVRRRVMPLMMGLTLLAPVATVMPPHSAVAAARTSAALAPQSFVAAAVARSGPAVVTLETQRTVAL